MGKDRDIANFLKAIRQQYGISQKSLGILLGISEPSMVRYEGGSYPSKSNEMLIRLAGDPAFMRNCFEDMGDLIPVDQQANMRARLDEIEAANNRVAAAHPSVDDKRISSAMNYIASHCRQPYFSRVIKGCFIADSLSYEKNGFSILGLQYAHAPHGPVIDGHKTLRGRLENEGLIELTDDGLGFLFETSDQNPATVSDFDEDELKILDEASSFVDSFDTIRELSDATHELSGWLETEEGQPIRFRREAEVTALVENRLYQPTEELIGRIDAAQSEVASSFETLEDLLAD